MVPRPASPILIVEDNAETRQVLGHVLGIRSYTSVMARDVPEALDYLRSGKRTCLIILDLHLPGRDGRDLLRELKTDPALAGIPVVVFSGHPDAVPEAAVCIRKGSESPDVLLEAIERYCLKE